MTTFRLDVPVWATISIEAASLEEAVSMVLAGATQDIEIIPEELAPGIAIRPSATVFLNPANWPATYDPATETGEQDEDDDED